MNVICKALALGTICDVEEPSAHLLKDSFAQHIAEYGLSYGTDEEFAFRFEQFKKADKIINEINASEGLFVAAHNKFSTMTPHEFKKSLGKKKGVENFSADRIQILDDSNLTAEVDWRAQGAVNPIQDQGQCGSCWSFSSTAAMEGAHFLATGNLLKLSEQQLVDCDRQSSGCNGGLEIYAFQYLEKAAQDLEADYPYTGRRGKCAASKKTGQV
jgi:cathepsin F